MGSVERYATSAGTRYRVRYRTPDRRQTDKRGFKTKREAEDFLATVEVSKLRGEWVDPTRSRVDVRAWSVEWFAAQSHLKATTLSGYRHALDKHVLPRWGSTRLADVSHADVQAWVAQLQTKLAPSTVRQTYLVLATMLKYAALDGRIAKNPADGIRLPRVIRKQRGYLTAEQVAKLAAAAGDHGDIVMLLATPA